MHLIKRFGLLLAATALVAACTAGDQSGSSDSTEGGAEGTQPVPSGPAPGVTDDAVKVGITYVDLASLGDVVSLDHGDYEASYQALFDDINEEGGIHGRTLEPVIAPVNPVGTDASDAACLRLTEDEQVFVVMGFFLDEGPMCYLDTHETGVIGGSMTDERLDRARAPWFTNVSGTDLQADAVRLFAEEGELDGTVGVFALAADEAFMNDTVLPILEENGVDVAESAVNDADPEDTAAANAATQTIAERFESQGVDQVLVVANAGLPWAIGVESTDYRPQLFFTDSNSVLAYASDAAGNDLTVLDDAVAANLYGGPQNLWELPGMQECNDTLTEAEVPIPEPDTVGEDEGDIWVAGFTACRDVALLRALLEAAGEDLNYGSFAAGADGLEVDLGIDPEPATYGPPPSADGDLPAWIYDWDPDEVDFVLREE